MENGNTTFNEFSHLVGEIGEEYKRYIELCTQLKAIYRAEIKGYYDIRLKASDGDLKLCNITMGDIASVHENKIVETRIKLIEKMQRLEETIKNDETR